MLTGVRRASADDAEAVSKLSHLCSLKYREDASAWAKAVSSQDTGQGCYIAETVPDTGSGPVVTGYGRFALEHGNTQDSTKYRVYVGVHPESRRRGIGCALLDRVLDELSVLGATAVRARVQSDQDETLAFLARHGFAEYDHKVVLELDLATLETADISLAVRERAGRVALAGVSLLSLADWSKQDPCYLSKLLHVRNTIGNDVPQPDPHSPVTMGELLRFLADPGVPPEGFFVALHKGEPIGLSYLSGPQSGDHVIVGITGVTREFRRLGVATAMKLMGIQYARSRGIRTMVTGASVRNMASIALNEGMGFRRSWEEIRLEKRLA